MKIIIFAPVAMILMLAAPAYAQSKPSTSPTLEQMMNGKTPEQIEKEKAADRAYKQSLQKIPDAKAPSDPWGSARSADAPKAAAKTPRQRRRQPKLAPLQTNIWPSASSVNRRLGGGAVPLSIQRSQISEIRNPGSR